jgi:hypothetical protein
VTPSSLVEDSGLNDIRSQKMVCFIVTAMETSSSTLKGYNFGDIHLPVNTEMVLVSLSSFRESP